MSEPNPPRDAPPELSPEYADAYRRAYERALRGDLGGDLGSDVADQVLTGRHAATDESVAEEPVVDEPVDEPVERAPFDESELESTVMWSPPPAASELPRPPARPGLATSAVEPEPALSPAEPTRRLEGYDYLFAGPPKEPAAPTGPAGPSGPSEPLLAGVAADYDEAPRERPAWFVLALLGGLALLLIVAAFGLGRLFSSSVGDTTASDGPDRVVLGDGSGDGGSGSGSGGDDNPEENRYRGRTQAATIGGASASCEAPASVDSAGNPVRYEPRNTYDGDLTTAWRCEGDGSGQSLTLSLAESSKVGEVGLVPGYAKTDPRSGVDRYAENNRITRVRWVFSDGTSYVQRLDGSPRNRELQTMRIPVTEADQVRIEVLDSVRGPRNTIAVSEVRIGAAAG